MVASGTISKVVIWHTNTYPWPFLIVLSWRSQSSPLVVQRGGRHIPSLLGHQCSPPLLCTPSDQTPLQPLESGLLPISIKYIGTLMPKDFWHWCKIVNVNHKSTGVPTIYTVCSVSYQSHMHTVYIWKCLHMKVFTYNRGHSMLLIWRRLLLDIFCRWLRASTWIHANYSNFHLSRLRVHLNVQYSDEVEQRNTYKHLRALGENRHRAHLPCRAWCETVYTHTSVSRCRPRNWLQLSHTLLLLSLIPCRYRYELLIITYKTPKCL